MLGAIINQAKETIETSCKDTKAGEECNVSAAATINITKDIAEMSGISYGPGEGFSEGESLNLPAGSLTFQKLSDSRLEYALTLDMTKIDDEIDDNMPSTITFSWSSAGDILRVYYSDKKGHNSTFTMLKTALGTKKMISNGYFDTGVEGGTYIMEVRLLDDDSHKISETMSYYDSHNITEVLSKGVIDDTNGSVYLQPWAPNGISFNNTGAAYGKGTNPTVDTIDKENGAILKGKVSGDRFVIVKAGEKVGKYTVLGYIFKAYDGISYEYEYFGKDDLLADKDATSDTDKLDVYMLDASNTPSTSKVTGFWLTKE